MFSADSLMFACAGAHIPEDQAGGSPEDAGLFVVEVVYLAEVAVVEMRLQWLLSQRSSPLSRTKPPPRYRPPLRLPQRPPAPRG